MKFFTTLRANLWPPNRTLQANLWPSNVTIQANVCRSRACR